METKGNYPENDFLLLFKERHRCCELCLVLVAILCLSNRTITLITGPAILILATFSNDLGDISEAYGSFRTWTVYMTGTF